MNQVRHSRRQHPARVFISHSVEDVAFARKLRNLLSQRANVRVFIPDDLSAGGKWETKVRDEISRADLVLALLTPKSVNSSWVLQELGAAWALEKPIIPVLTRLDVLNRLPIHLDESKAIELPDVDTAENADRFVEAFEDRLDLSPARSLP